MITTLDMLVKTLIERFAAANFDVPDAMTQEQRESFVFQALVHAAILPADEHARLIAAAREVVNCWESRSLAEAVRNLDMALAAFRPAIIVGGKPQPDPNDTTKPKWHVEYATTVHAISEEEAFELAEHDFAIRNCVTKAEKYQQ